MMRKISYLLTCLFCFAWLTSSADLLDKGVSKQLAEQRAQNISNVSYDLEIDIPSNEKIKVGGTVTISFSLSKKTDVVLDFQGIFSGACIVNGKKRIAETVNEHIFIPRKMLKKGHNTVEMDFASLNKALNRHSDYMYTLFVPDQARSCFPCFDQPDLRATFTTHLTVPKGWKTMVSDGQKPIPTYLYSFVAGKFEEQTAQRGSHNIRVLYLEKDEQKTGQLSKIIDEVGHSLQWMEWYTSLKCPFKEYGMVILPGYQFGGMEHPGAIQMSDRRLFLGNSPSQDDELSRMELIAHETAHLWFGDMVSLKWFEDVWAKEVFANFMASKIIRQQFTDIDHDVNFLKSYQARAAAFDRTEGTHPIAQDLQNMDHASLLYDDIIYDKAPVMMRVLEDIMGERSLRQGLQRYLRKYYFSNASWDDLVTMLDQQKPDAGVRQFSEVWVKQKGMPIIHTSYQDGKLIIKQTDPYGRGLWWRQKFDIRLIYDLDPSLTITVDMRQPTMVYNLKNRPNSIVPNYDGRGYGRFTLDEDYTRVLPLRLMITRNDLNRYALLLTLFDNYLMGRIPNSYFSELYRNMMKETNPLVMSTTIDQMLKIAFDMPTQQRMTLELCMMDMLKENKSQEFRQLLIRKLAGFATSPEVLAKIENIWKQQDDPLFDEHDYMSMAYRLAIMNPDRWNMIINSQHNQLKSVALQEEFDYVSRACNPDQESRLALFDSLLYPENRQHEPWAIQAIRLLNSDVYEPQSNIYIPASLGSLEYLRQTSDIFFANNWLNALLSSHKSEDALRKVNAFLRDHPGYQENLRNKILVATWPLKNILEKEQGIKNK